jgi:hypothetical protein
MREGAVIVREADEMRTIRVELMVTRELELTLQQSFDTQAWSDVIRHQW